MNDVKANTLRVPGATLFYEVRGRGPILLLIPGGGNDSHVFTSIATYLADQYTVVTYDRRGLSQSTLDNPEEEPQIETHSDDAYRLLSELGGEHEPAYVLGSSAGAIIALDLVARYPNYVSTLIAHEPPTHLSPVADPVREMGAIREIYLHQGLSAAGLSLMAQPSFGIEGRELDMVPPPQLDREQAEKNVRFLFEREFSMCDRYQFDFPALARAAKQSRIVIAGGSDGAVYAEYHSAVAVADRLGTTVVEFPGRHVGYVTNPRGFAQRLREVLAEKKD